MAITSKAITDREQEMYDAVLTDNIEIMLGTMDEHAKTLGGLFGEIYAGLDRRGDRKAARRVFRRLLDELDQTVWAQILPTTADEEGESE